MKVSIIIPIYNLQKYLIRCIESVLNQTYDDWELILVDDGSTDESPLICDEYSLKDKRIKVIHQENGGESAARNKGLEMAQAEWVTFIDADDYVFPGYISDMFKFVSSEVDMVVSGYIMGNEKSPTFQIIDKYNQLDYFKSKIHLGFAWGKLLKRDIIIRNKLIFPIGVKWSPDVLFIYNYVTCCQKRIILIPNTNYFYYHRQNSAAKKMYPVLSELKGLSESLSLSERLSELYSNKIFNYFTPYFFLVRTINSLYKFEKDRKKRLEILNKLEFKKSWMVSNSSNLKEKIVSLLIINKKWTLLDLVLDR